MCIIVCSVITLCAETLPQYRLDAATGADVPPPLAIFVLETIWTSLFTLEYIWRLIVADEKLGFVQQPMNLVDLVRHCLHFVLFSCSVSIRERRCLANDTGRRVA